MAAIEMRGVTKRFGDITALDDVTLTVEPAEVYGFLGPNGAGKSTTIDLLLDFIRADAGDMDVLGRDVTRAPVAIKQRTGVLPEGFELYDRLTAREHVAFAIESKQSDEDPAQLLDRVGLAADADRRAGGFSKGMGQRLGLAMALVGSPELLILDEPTAGLDPNAARELQSIVREERDRGAAVFFSSHLLGQVEAVCDRVGILRDGALVAEDSIEGLRETRDTDTTLRISIGAESAAALDAVRDVGGVSDVSRTNGSLTVVCRSGAKMDVLGALEARSIAVEDFTTEETSLTELFARYTEGPA